VYNGLATASCEGQRLENASAERLSARTKLAYALGDHSLNLSLSTLSIFYLFFLTEIGGIRPGLAGFVLFVGRVVDALADPLMGRLSDRTPWKWGRRRPYLALGALPFGLSFALLWVDLGPGPQSEKFLFYSGVYVLHSLASTVVGVPYAALLPELTLDYQERTTLSVWRAAGSTLAILLAAVLFRRLAHLLGGLGGGYDYTRAGLVTACWLTLPWIAVYAATRERPGFQRPSATTFVQGLAVLTRNRVYRRLVGLYVCSRITMDLIGAMFLFWFTYWICRPEDFEFTLGLLLFAAALSLPFWLRLSAHRDKQTVFLIGTSFWLLVQCLLFGAGPGWSRDEILLLGVAAGIGFAVTDVVPWSMLADVIDADELETGERREGLYFGTFSFLRKLAGASAVSLAGIGLELAGFLKDEPQPPGALFAIRLLVGVVPAGFLALALWMARGYTLSREAHARIRAALDARAGAQLTR
jgi:sugar (glycoside-pentoside-hexuronide) transporter